jgi:YHS domain-containing protein
MPEAVENPTSQTVHDPVCHMDMPAIDTAGSVEHDGLTYYFCSEGCQHDFEADPEGVLEAESDFEHQPAL